MHKEGCRCRDDDKESNEVGEDGSYPDLETLIFVVAHMDASLSHGALHVELHIWTDRRANGSDERQDIEPIELDGGDYGSYRNLAPIGMGEKGREDIGEEDKGQR